MQTANDVIASEAKQSNYKQYEKYKPSGIDWLGDIPEQWNRSTLKMLTKIKITDGPHETPKFLDEGVPFVSAEAVQNSSINFDAIRGYISEEQDIIYSKKCKPQKGDVFIVKSGSTTGKIAIVNTDKNFNIWSPIALVRFNEFKMNNLFGFYFLQSTIFQTQVQQFWSFGTQPNIGMNVLENLWLTIPSIQEQQAIAEFLDKKTAYIDKIVEKKKRMIELLKEKRQALISHAVTKGLDKNAKLKPSGIDWLGDIPEHWDITKIKYTTYVKGRIGWQGLRSDEFIEEGPYLVTGTDFLSGLIAWDTCYHISEERYNEAPPIQLKEGDLLITKDGTIGKVAIVENMPDKAILNSGIFVTRALSDEYLTSFMYWLLNSDVFSGYIKYSETGSTIKHLYQDTFVNFVYPLPSIEEQRGIAEFLDEKTARIDEIVSKIEQQIEKLKEYRQTLISNAVTGKIDVRIQEQA